MNRRWRQWSARVTATAAFVLLAVTGFATPAHAWSSSVSASIAKSSCTPTATSWFGGYPTIGIFPYPNPQGTVKFCVYKLKFADTDSTADYYGIVLQSKWTFTKGSRDYPAAMNQSAYSNIGALSAVYDGTGSFTSNVSCTSPLTIGLNIGVFSAAVTPTVCSGFKVTAAGATTTGDSWSSPKAGGLTTLETMYVQKVPQGKVPLFSVNFGIPQYDVWFDTQWHSTTHIVYQYWNNF
ncbi:hypothetical protein [Dactylosporangium sp. NPDC048998]|uniref:hypothetical protein n=1 Tax=Dactylosporangium sp. NPDC048998 TaxID=3363976 RepID=UPI00371921BC